MEQLSSITRHIPRGENHWSDLLSWFRSVPRVGGDTENAGARTHATVVVVPARLDSSMQSKGENRDGQDAVMEGHQKVETLLGTAVRDRATSICGTQRGAGAVSPLIRDSIYTPA